MQLTRDGFVHSGWEDVIAGAHSRECTDYCSGFLSKARKAKDSGDSKAEELFSLLGNICSLHLKLDSPEQPLGPVWSSQGGRSAIAEDFDEGQLQFLESIVSEIPDHELRARIADVLWLRKPHYRMAELAISSYLESAKILEDPENWVGTDERIERALQLALRMGRNAQPYASVIEYIESVLSRCNGEDPLFLSWKMMTLLQERKAGDPAKYIPISEKLALRAEEGHDWERAKAYWSIKSKWHLMAGDKEQAREAKLLAAETYVKQSEDFFRGDPPNHSLVSTFLQKAIEAFRRVGNEDARVHELHLRLLTSQQKSVAELRTISSSLDITETVRRTVEHVKGKSVVEALLNLATIANPLDSANLRSQAVENKKKYLFQSLLPRVYVNALGRVIARQPVDEEESLRADMYSNASQFQSIHVQALIEPARRQVISEHNVRVGDFVALLSDHRLIPAGREVVVARGLHAGLNGDFLVSTHLLIPQIEESVRYLLIQVGVIASALDQRGIQEEHDLNRTLCDPKYSESLAKLFGEDLLFAMRGLLVERFGANLRNDMAHGLLDHDSFYSPSSCYLWWLAFRLYSWPVLAKLKMEQSSGGEGAPQQTEQS